MISLKSAVSWEQISASTMEDIKGRAHEAWRSRCRPKFFITMISKSSTTSATVQSSSKERCGTVAPQQHPNGARWADRSSLLWPWEDVATLLDEGKVPPDWSGNSWTGNMDLRKVTFIRETRKKADDTTVKQIVSKQKVQCWRQPTNELPEMKVWRFSRRKLRNGRKYPLRLEQQKSQHEATIVL